FRQDLFYRLNVIQLPRAPLRERPQAIPLLPNHLLGKLAQAGNLPVPPLSAQATARLSPYQFPGNVRELENILERAFALTDNDIIDVDDLQLNGEQPFARMTEGNSQNISSNFVDYPARCAEYPSLDDYLRDVEKDILCDMLEQMKWNKTLAAKHLGISFRSLRYRLQKLGLDDD